MFVLGLILILLSAGALVAVLVQRHRRPGRDVRRRVDLSTLVVFLAGAAALLLFIMGLELVRSGVQPGQPEPQEQEAAAQAREARGGRAEPTSRRPAGTTGTHHGHRRRAPPPAPPRHRHRHRAPAPARRPPRTRPTTPHRGRRAPATGLTRRRRRRR